MKHEHQKIYVDERGKTRVVTINLEPTMAQQQFADECDINNIIKKHSQTGIVTHINTKKGVYADITSVTDYHTMVNLLNDAKTQFMQLPAEIRKKFDNDPGKLIEFLNDRKNYDEALKLGLLDPKLEAEKPQNAIKRETTKKADAKLKKESDPAEES